MYGTIMCFDEKAEEEIKRLWNGLEAAKISTYHIDKNGQQKRPHITLADYHELNVEQYSKKFKAFFDQKEGFEVNLSILGSFPNNGTLFVSPVMNQEIFQLHKDYHRDFTSLSNNHQSYYVPNNWVPHCTIANHLTQNQLMDAFDYVFRTFKPIKARVSEIVLIKLVVSNGTIIGSEPVFSHRLCNNK